MQIRYFLLINLIFFSTTTIKAQGTLDAWGYDAVGQVSDMPMLNDFISVSSGENHNIGLLSDGSIVSWGADQYLQVGDAPSRTGFSAVEAGGNHSLAIKTPSLAYPPVFIFRFSAAACMRGSGEFPV